MDRFNVIFDAERMKYPHTGLYHFCKQLGLALLEENKDTESFDIQFYISDLSSLPFGNHVNYIQQKSMHKFLRPFLPNTQLWHSTYQLSSYFPRNPKTTILTTIHDLNFLKEGKSNEKERKYLKKLQNNLDRTDSVVAISNYVKQDLLNYCNLRGKEIQVVYNGSNMASNSLANRGMELSSNNDKPFMFTIGTVNRKKNFHVLPYLLVGNNLELVISGIINQEGYDNHIMEIAHQLGVAKRIRITGPISEEEKYSYLKKCSLFVFPSIAEGFGLPVIEAMSLGKKVLLSNYTCLPEIGGPEAFFLESTNPDYLIEFGKLNLMDIINGEDRTAEIKSWASQFSWDKAAREYWKLYNELLK
ncbi:MULTISPECIES: glycosyltransferase family 4 protein [Sphingobacterium]|uniref:glycosyltransferase family 4 protein n=1 Tax=Sphingobacterium TaxID=28453 RepID=UPI00257E2255|nr:MULTISPECIES: glycosyltransferase family 1 protein [Sphingobacterium]